MRTFVGLCTAVLFASMEYAASQRHMSIYMSYMSGVSPLTFISQALLQSLGLALNELTASTNMGMLAYAEMHVALNKRVYG